MRVRPRGRAMKTTKPSNSCGHVYRERYKEIGQLADEDKEPRPAFMPFVSKAMYNNVHPLVWTSPWPDFTPLDLALHVMETQSFTNNNTNEQTRTKNPVQRSWQSFQKPCTTMYIHSIDFTCTRTSLELT